MIKKYVILILLLFTSGKLIAQESGLHWDFAGWFGAGCTPNIFFDPNNKDRVYLTSDVSGIWRSDDLGENWSFINKGLTNANVAAIIGASSNTEVFYAATAGGLHLSSDAGKNWVKLKAPLKEDFVFKRPESYRPITISSKNSAQVCIGTHKGKIFCSKDFGNNWNQISLISEFFPEGFPITAIALVDDDKYLLASNKKGLFMYGFEKSKWKEVITNQQITDFEVSKNKPTDIYATGGKELLISRDAGRTWDKTDSISSGKTYRVALGEAQGQTKVYVAWWGDGWNGGVVSLQDDQKSWKKLDSNLNVDMVKDPTWAWNSPGGRTFTLKVNPFDNNVLFRTDWGVFRSDDGGKNWNEKINGAPNTAGSDITFAPDGSLYVASMDNGLLKSIDQGKSYKAIFPSKGYDSKINGHVWRIKAVDDKKFIATSSPWNDNVNQIVLSDDGGESFKLIREGLPQKRPTVNTMWGPGYARALAIDPKDSNIVYLGIDGDDGGGLFISKDGGETWSRSSGQPGSLRVYNGLAVDPEDSNVLYWAACGDKGGVYVSKDRGNTWQYVFKDSQWIFDLHVSSSGVVYAAGDQSGAALFASFNKGKSWKRIGKFSDKGLAEAITTSPVDPNIIIVSTASGSDAIPHRIFLSKDAGKSWNDITGDLPDGVGAAAMIFSNDAQDVYMTRYAGGVYRLKL